MIGSFEKQVREALEGGGCTFVKRGECDYEIWHNPKTNRHFPVDDIIKSRRHANTVMRLSRVEHQF
ncbi:MAG: type II toxin-antitoxin system HicA family toxin [Oscillospiraceae bacterium]|nr:type II toxin-antitoxin system HicA family toxin [Oscillospiraceae bacterium]